MHKSKRDFLWHWALASFVVCALAMLPGSSPVRADDGHHGGPTFNVHNLHGRYISAGNSSDASITGTASEPNPPAVPFVGAGFLNFDGAGHIASGEETINYGSPGTGDSFTCELAGSYTVDSATGRAILTVNVTPGPPVTTAESAGSNSQCGGTATWVGYIGGPDGKQLATIEQTNTGGTPTPPANSTTPILSAHIWTKTAGFGH
jgi:hypothetical protein